ncbi:hypothetical protein ABND12_17965 [Paenibacillus larvae]
MSYRQSRHRLHRIGETCWYLTILSAIQKDVLLDAVRWHEFERWLRK